MAVTIPDELVSSELASGIYTAQLVPSRGYAIESAAPATLAAWWLTGYEDTDGNVTDIAEGDAGSTPAWVESFALVAHADGPGGEKRYSPEVSINQLAWDLPADTAAVGFAFRVSNGSDAVFETAYLPSTISEVPPEVTEVVGAETAPAPFTGSLYFFDPADSSHAVDQQYFDADTGNQSAGGANTAQASLVGEVGSAFGVYHKTGASRLSPYAGDFMRWRTVDQNRNHIELDSVNHPAIWGTGDSYFAMMLGITGDHEFRARQNSSNSRILSFGNSGAAHMRWWNGSSWTNVLDQSTIDLTDGNAHLVEIVKGSNGNFDVYVDLVKVIDQFAAPDPSWTQFLLGESDSFQFMDVGFIYAESSYDPSMRSAAQTLFETKTGTTL